MAHLVFAIALGAAAALGGLLLLALVVDGFHFWPPPRERSWQDYAFWGLFRLHCLGIGLTALLDSGTLDWEHWTRLAVGIPVMLGFLGLTLYGYGFLGLDNTYGRRAGWSRAASTPSAATRNTWPRWPARSGWGLRSTRP